MGRQPMNIFGAVSKTKKHTEDPIIFEGAFMFEALYIPNVVWALLYLTHSHLNYTIILGRDMKRYLKFDLSGTTRKPLGYKRDNPTNGFGLWSVYQ